MDENNTIVENENIESVDNASSDNMSADGNSIDETSVNEETAEDIIELDGEEYEKLLKKARRKGAILGSIISAIVIILLIIVSVGGTLVYKFANGYAPSKALSLVSSGIINNDVYKKGENLFAIIENTYLYDIDKEALQQGMYKGMVEALGDPYSTYYTEEEFAQMMESSNGSFEGIGAYMQQDPEDMKVVVTRPMMDSPAEKAGILSGDVVVSVDGEDVVGQDINVVVSKIRGPAGTTVVVGIERKDEIIEFEIERGIVHEDSVAGEIQDEENHIGYIYVSSFEEDTANQFKKILNKLKDEGATSLIIDMRDNGGGYVDVCVDMVDMILPEGNIVSIKDKHGFSQNFEADDTEFIRMPIVILVNENSASATEIFTGALKDNDYATVIGTTTFGKGIVQDIIPFEDGSGLKVTSSEYYTPSGVCIHGIGIEPDINVEFDYDKYLETGDDNQYNRALKYLIDGE